MDNPDDIGKWTPKISVIDSGIGIKKRDMKRLFKPFGMLDSEDQVRENPNGTGLGLK